MDFLKSLPKWALMALAGYVAVLFTFAIFDGRRVDFWPPAIHQKGGTPTRNAVPVGRIAELEKELAEKKSYISPKETLNMFPEPVREKTLKATADRVSRLVEDVSDKNSELAVLREKAESIENIEGDFLFRVLTFHAEALCYGDSLNFTHPPLDPEKCTEKEALSKQLLGFLAEIEFYGGPVAESPKEAKSELIRYQETKAFGRKGWYSRDVFKWIIIDYYGKA